MYADVLLAIDLDENETWERALPAAVAMARLKPGRLHVLTVLPDIGSSWVDQYFPKDYEKTISDKAMERLHAFVEEQVPPDVRVQHMLGQGKIYDAILYMAHRCKADLIVVGAHRPDLSDYLLGPNAARVVRHAQCSVLVVR